MKKTITTILITVIAIVLYANFGPAYADCNAPANCASTECVNGTECSANTMNDVPQQTLGAGGCKSGVQDAGGSCGSKFIRSNGIDCIKISGGCGGVTVMNCSS